MNPIEWDWPLDKEFKIILYSMSRAMKKLMLLLFQMHVYKIKLENKNFKNLKGTIFILKIFQTKMLKIHTAKIFC